MAKAMPGPEWEELMRKVCDAWGIDLPQGTYKVEVKIDQHFMPILTTTQWVKVLNGRRKTIQTEWSGIGTK